MNTTTLNMTTLDGGVIIKRGGSGSTPTPPSGGESGGSGLKYYRNDAFYGAMPVVGTFLLKYELEEMFIIVPTNTLLYELGRDLDMNSIKAFAFDPSAKIMDMGNDPSSFITMMEFWEAATTNELHEITKEQFYSLD